MKKILAASLALSLVASAGAASAQSYDYRSYDHGRDGRYDSYQHDRDGRYEQEQRYDRQAYRAERRAERAEHRYERRAAKRYAAGRYQRPSGYQQRHWRYGERLPASYRTRSYVVDHRHYGLQAPPRGYQYTRVDNDVVLTAIASGVIAAVIAGMFQ